MRRSIGFLLAGTLLVSACQLQMKELAPKKPTTTAAKKTSKASPAPTASPSASPLPDASASPAALAEPTEPSTLLKGLVTIDASYVISTGGGNVISTGGGNVISTGGGNVISTGGGNVISTGGGNVISVGGGNVISTGGGNVISTGGGNVISTGGGNVISTGGGNFRLLADAIAIPVGTMLPIKSMVVVPVSLLDARQVGPAVFTDEKGGYSVTYPEALKGQIRLYAAVPVKDPSEPNFNNYRLSYDLLATSKTATTLDMTEDSAAVTRLVRKIFQSKLAAIMTPENLSGGTDQLGNGEKLGEDIPEFQKLIAVAIANQLMELVKKYNVPQDKIPLMASRLGDRLLAGIDIYEMQISKEKAGSYEGEPKPVVQYTMGLLEDLRKRALSKQFPENYRQVIADKIVKVNEEYKARNVQITEENKTLPADQQKSLRPLRPALKDATSPFVAGRASEMSEFVISEFMSHAKGEFDNFELVLEDLKQAGDAEDYLDKTELQWSSVGQVFGYYFVMEFIEFSQAKDDKTGKTKLELFFESYPHAAIGS